jgi:hypothetical protein
VTPALADAGLPEPDLVLLKSPYRRVISPVLNHIWQLEHDHPDRIIAVLIPQLIESRWYYSFLHNQKGAVLRTLLLLKGCNRIITVNVPWHLSREHRIFGDHPAESFSGYPAWMDRK